MNMLKKLLCSVVAMLALAAMFVETTSARSCKVKCEKPCKVKCAPACEPQECRVVERIPLTEKQVIECKKMVPCNQYVTKMVPQKRCRTIQKCRMVPECYYENVTEMVPKCKCEKVQETIMVPKKVCKKVQCQVMVPKCKKVKCTRMVEKPYCCKEEYTVMVPVKECVQVMKPEYSTMERVVPAGPDLCNVQ